MLLYFTVQAFFIVLTRASGHTYYVKPDNFSINCSSQEHPCLTLDEYASNQSKFFTSNSTFLFLPGTHTTRTVVNLVNVSNILLKGFGSSPELCYTEWSVKCENVSGISFQELIMTFTRNAANSTLTFIDSRRIQAILITFQGNGLDQNRAILMKHSSATFENCTFREHFGEDYGGALLIIEKSEAIVSNSTFISNSAQQSGGAILVDKSQLNVSRTTFRSNSAAEAGGIYCHKCSLHARSANFVNNLAPKVIGGAMVTESAIAKFINITMLNNSEGAACFYRSDIVFSGVNIFKGNVNTNYAGGAFLLQTSTSVTFLGFTLFQDNYAFNAGGAIASFVLTHLIFGPGGVTRFINNTAKQEGGGAVALDTHAKLEMHGSVLFENNNCTTCYGGAISVTDASKVEIIDSVIFEQNIAKLGGAVYVRSSNVVLNREARIETVNNHAKHFGGGIFHVDFINYYQCNFTMNAPYDHSVTDFSLPDCFLRFKNFSIEDAHTYQIISINDTAGIDGQFMYGGLMDKCHITDYNKKKILFELLYNIIFKYKILQIQQSNDSTNSRNAISSQAFTLCFCKNNQEFNCTAVKQISTIRGGRFNVSVVALSQGNAITAPVILAEVSETARLKLDQTSRWITPTCSTISYNMYSTEEQELLVIYPDETCRDTGLAKAVINVTFLPCPAGFSQSDDECICDERLQKYTDQCIIGDERNYIFRTSSSRFWVGYSNETTFGVGLILYRSCPVGYCKTSDVNISLTDIDTQCAFNHSGLLCGSCGKDYSLTFGDPRCQECSNMFLLLLIAFAAAGVFLVAFISILRLTVATGMINSIILYANIVQANKAVFFSNNNNVLTVFIAWMNLDLGIPTCFYDGMDAYAQTWLQFAFPLYVWFLITLIIITSRYSTLVTKLIGSNPIAVLATLLLMSYTKILKSIIEIFFSVHLEYPNTTVTVWFKDATVPYLESKHLLLAVLSSIFIAAFFLPYTFLLLLGYKMYRYSEVKFIRRLIMKVKPLLDSYYAPHENHTRFWPGLLLLVRCGLFIVFSFDFINQGSSLLAINTSLSILIVVAWLLSWHSVRIYEKFSANMIEALVFLNLVILSAAKSSNFDSFELTFSLVGMVFAIMICIIFYQF